MKPRKWLWKVYAGIYDRILLQFHPYLELLSQVRKALDVQDGQRVLDAGCGTGNLLLCFAKSPADLFLVGIDFEKAMLERARNKLKTYENITVQEEDLNFPLPFADEKFDRIACVNTLYALGNPGQFMEECKRLLKKGGKLVLVTPPEKPRMGPIFKEHLRALRSRHPQFWLLLVCGQILWLSPSLLLFLLINRIIQGQSSFNFFAQKELFSLVSQRGLAVDRLEKTYGGQAWLLVCTKQGDVGSGSSGEGAGA